MDLFKKIVFIDEALPGLEVLSQVSSSAKIVFLSHNAPLLSQMAQAMENMYSVEHLHLFTHGHSGELVLGENGVSLETLPLYGKELATISNAMSTDGELYLYGCEVAAGEKGAAFVKMLGDITGLKVAAATHKVGYAELGGSWELDAKPSTMENALHVSEWRGVLEDTAIDGTLLALNTFDRPKTYADDNGVSYENIYYTANSGDITGQMGAQFQYFTRNVTPNADGAFTFSVTAAEFSDTFLLLYAGSFDPLNPLTNLILAQDDIDVSNLWSNFSYDLVGGQTYVLVLTSFDTSATGTLTVNVSGPSSVEVASNEFSSDAPPPAKSLAYDITTVSEADANNGSITEKFTVTLSGDTFTGSNDTALSGVTVSNVPAGLTAVVTKKTDTTAEISFTGSATAHADANDIANLQVVFADAAFTGGSAATVTNATKSNLAINFADPTVPTVSLSVGTSTIAEATGVATVTATISESASVDTIVTLASTGTATGSGTDYSLSSTTITITAGQTTGTATITAVQDTIDEIDETVIVAIDSVSGGGGATESGTQTQTITILDDDAEPTISIANTSLTEGHSGSSNMTFTVTLSAVSSKAISVNYATSNATATAGSDYTATNGTLNFAAGETSKTFTVAIWGDTSLEGNETITTTLSNPTNATLGTSTATGTITDDENATPVNTVPSAQTTNEDTAKVFNTAGGNALTVSDAENATLTTTLSIASGKGALSITATGHGASVTSTATSIELIGTAAQINAALEGFTYTPTANANGASYATLSVVTSDGVTADTDTVAINVTAVDDAPIASSMAASVSLSSKQLFSSFTPTYSDVENDIPTQLKILSMPSKGSFEVYDGDGERTVDTNWTALAGINSSNPLSIAMGDLGNYRFNAGNDTGVANVDWAVQTNGLWSNTATGVVTIVDSASNVAPIVNIYDVNNSNADLSNGTLTVVEDGTSTAVKLVFSDDITPEEFMQGIIGSSNTDLIDMSCISMTRSTTTDAGDTVTLTFTPKANAYGNTIITLGASDGDKSTTKTFTLSVTPTNEQAVAQDFLKTINEDGTFYFNTINPADIYTDANDVNMNKDVVAVDYNVQMGIIITAQQAGATDEQRAAAGTAITNLVNANLFPKSFLIKTLPTHGKLYLGETEITTENYSVAIENLANLKYVPTANYSGSDSFTWQGVDVNDLATTTKTATFTINEANDLPTGSVTISGTPTQGQTLTAANTLADVDGLGAITYQWEAGGEVIVDATESTLVLSQSHVGKVITVTASYTDQHATVESTTSDATTAVANINDLPTGSVTISGKPTQGKTLTAANTLADVDGLGTIAYQWKADGVDIEDATESTLVLSQSHVGKVITVTARYTDQHATVESITSDATTTVANINDLPTGSVTISGTPTQGQTLTAANTLADVDGLGTITYQWKADGEIIVDATESTLVLSQSHVGKVITVMASYTDEYATAESITSDATAAISAPRPRPTPTPTPVEPEVPVVPVKPKLPTPPPATETVDGTTVETSTKTETRTTTDANGNTVTKTVTTESLVIAPVTDNRTDTTGTATTADVPLFWGESTKTEWATTASLPSGVGLTTDGSRAPKENATLADAIDDLIYYIDTTVDESDPDKAKQKDGGSTFLQKLENMTDTLVVNKVVLNVDTNLTTIAKPITISGSANVVATSQSKLAPMEALVIDASKLPINSRLDLKNVEFAVIVGENLTVRGGDGANILFAGAGSQNIVLGEDDDELYAGAGDDIIGSVSGNDAVYGEAGDDIVFGGAGRDILSGGTGSDTINGGLGYDRALQEGAKADYTILVQNGVVTLTDTVNGSVDTLIDINQIEFENGDIFYIANNKVQEKILLTMGHSKGDILYVPITQTQTGTSGNDIFVLSEDSFGLSINGLAGIDTLKIDGKQDDFRIEDTANGIEVTSLIDGSMVELINFESIEFDAGIDGINVVIVGINDDNLI